MNRRFVVTLALIACLLIGLPAMSAAQSGSYVETIYQAAESALSQITNENGHDFNSKPAEPLTDEPLVIPGSELIATGTASPEEKIQNIISDLLRILTARMIGIPISLSNIKVVSCEKVLPPTDTNTGTDTGTNTETETGTDTGTDTGTNTETETSTDTGTDTGTNTGTNTETDTSTDTGTGTDTGTDTSTDTGTDTGTDVEPEDPLGELKDSINEKYGIEVADGDGAVWTEGQLNTVDETYSQLPAKFLGFTKKVVRDEKGPEGAPETARGYVQPPHLVVHMLNPSTVISDDLYQQLKVMYGRDPTEEEQLYQIKKGFQKTLVHEMGHCFHIANPLTFDDWKNSFWPGGVIKGDSVSTYGETKAEEDFAESCGYYFLGGKIVGDYFVAANGGKIDLERYNFIKTRVMDGKEFLTE